MAVMLSTKFWDGFEKQANAFSHAAELGGLATLAAPSVQALRGKKMKDSTAHKTELAGLGILAAPTLVNLAKKAVGK